MLLRFACLHVHGFDALEEDDRIGDAGDEGGLLEHSVEEGRARGEDDLVGAEGRDGVGAGQGHVEEVGVGARGLDGGGHGGLEVVPGEVQTAGHGDGVWGWGGGNKKQQQGKGKAGIRGDRSERQKTPTIAEKMTNILKNT